MNSVKLLHTKCCFFRFFNNPVALKNSKNISPPQEKVEMTPLLPVFLDGMPLCEYTVDANKTRMMISCHFTMYGNLEPSLNCSFHHHPSTHVDSWSVIKNGSNITILAEIQLSTTQSDLDANFTCAIVVDGGSRIYHVLTPLNQHQNVPSMYTL